MSEDLKLLARFIWPEKFESLCRNLQNSGIEFFIEEQMDSSSDPFFPSVFGVTEIYVPKSIFEEAMAVKKKTAENSD